MLCLKNEVLYCFWPFHSKFICVIWKKVEMYCYTYEMYFIKNTEVYLESLINCLVKLNPFIYYNIPGRSAKYPSTLLSSAYFLTSWLVFLIGAGVDSAVAWIGTVFKTNPPWSQALSNIHLPSFLHEKKAQTADCSVICFILSSVASNKWHSKKDFREDMRFPRILTFYNFISFITQTRSSTQNDLA